MDEVFKYIIGDNITKEAYVNTVKRKRFLSSLEIDENKFLKYIIEKNVIFPSAILRRLIDNVIACDTLSFTFLDTLNPIKAHSIVRSTKDDFSLIIQRKDGFKFMNQFIDAINTSIRYRISHSFMNLTNTFGIDIMNLIKLFINLINPSSLTSSSDSVTLTRSPLTKFSFLVKQDNNTVNLCYLILELEKQRKMFFEARKKSENFRELVTPSVRLFIVGKKCKKLLSLSVKSNGQIILLDEEQLSTKLKNVYPQESFSNPSTLINKYAIFQQNLLENSVIEELFPFEKLHMTFDGDVISIESSDANNDSINDDKEERNRKRFYKFGINNEYIKNEIDLESILKVVKHCSSADKLLLGGKEIIGIGNVGLIESVISKISTINHNESPNMKYESINNNNFKNLNRKNSNSFNRISNNSSNNNNSIRKESSIKNGLLLKRHRNVNLNFKSFINLNSLKLFNSTANNSTIPVMFINFWQTCLNTMIYSQNMIIKMLGDTNSHDDNSVCFAFINLERDEIAWGLMPSLHFFPSKSCTVVNAVDVFDDFTSNNQQVYNSFNDREDIVSICCNYPLGDPFFKNLINESKKLGNVVRFQIIHQIYTYFQSFSTKSSGLIIPRIDVSLVSNTKKDWKKITNQLDKQTFTVTPIFKRSNY
ncbi:MAG: hypothetical protein QM535_15010 [Limnohabitans sp.]|nr:hypothetical protein [Limnohabitans sp.]